jgi:hypothetical protein
MVLHDRAHHLVHDISQTAVNTVAHGHAAALGPLLRAAAVPNPTGGTSIRRTAAAANASTGLLLLRLQTLIFRMRSDNAIVVRRPHFLCELPPFINTRVMQLAR